MSPGQVAYELWRGTAAVPTAHKPWHLLEPGARERWNRIAAKAIEIAKPHPLAEEQARIIADLSLLVMRMARRLSITTPGEVNVAGNKNMAKFAGDFLRRMDLTSPLRGDRHV
jgi:hypothetical protein